MTVVGGIPFIMIGFGFLAALLPQLDIASFGIASVFIAIGIGYLVVSYGLWKGKRWAWSITLILSYIGIASSIFPIGGGNPFSIVRLIISIAIVYFLYRPQVKEFFGKSPNAKV